MHLCTVGGVASGQISRSGVQGLRVKTQAVSLDMNSAPSHVEPQHHAAPAGGMPVSAACSPDLQPSIYLIGQLSRGGLSSTSLFKSELEHLVVCLRPFLRCSLQTTRIFCPFSYLPPPECQVLYILGTWAGNLQLTCSYSPPLVMYHLSLLTLPFTIGHCFVVM